MKDAVVISGMLGAIAVAVMCLIVGFVVVFLGTIETLERLL